MTTLYLSRFATPMKSSLMTGLMIFLFSYAVHAEAPQGQDAKAIIWSQDKRFSDNGDQTITDHKSGLMWMKIDAFQMHGHLMNWTESLTFVDKLNHEGFASYVDWRVPTRSELLTLYEPAKTNSAKEMLMHIDPIFPKDGLASYWSSETNGQYNAFGVVLNTGAVFNAPKSAKSNKTVRAVRNAK